MRLALLTTALVAVAPTGALAGDAEDHRSSCRTPEHPPATEHPPVKKEEAPPKAETPLPEAPTTQAPPAPPVLLAPPAAVPPPPPIVPVAQGRLEIVKSGPAQLRAGARARFVIAVRNTGRGAVRGVAVSDLLPGGFFVHAVALRASRGGAWRAVRPRLAGGRLIVAVGGLRAGRSALVRVTLGAQRSVRGRRCNVARVTAQNASAAVARACLRVFRPPLVKTPPRVTG